MKGYSTLPRSPELEPHHQIQFSIIPRTILFGKDSYPPLLQEIQSAFSKPHWWAIGPFALLNRKDLLTWQRSWLMILIGKFCFLITNVMQQWWLNLYKKFFYYQHTRLQNISYFTTCNMFCMANGSNKYKLMKNSLKNSWTKTGTVLLR